MSVLQLRGQHEFQRVLSKARESKQLVVVKFTASWCKPCQKIKPVFEQLAQNNYHTATCIELDVDEVDNNLLTSHFAVRSMPSFVFIVNNKVIHTLTGADEAQLIFIFKLLQDTIISFTKDTIEYSI